MAWLYGCTHTHPASVPGEEHRSQEVREIVSAAVDGVVRFMRENGFTLSIPKTVFIPFHTNNLLNRNLQVRINDDCIFASKKVKYLGVSFSCQGRTNLQVDNNPRNASRALNVKVLSAQPWANSPKILVSLVRSLVRSRLIYGLEVMPRITDSGLARLTRIEVRGLRIALGLPRSAPHNLVYREAGVLPLGQHIQLSAAKYKFRCQTVTNSTVHEVEESFRGPAQGRLCSSICDSIRDLVPGAGVDGARVAERPIHPLPSLVVGESERPGGHGEPDKGGEPACGAVCSQRVPGKELQELLRDLHRWVSVGWRRGRCRICCSRVQ